MKHMTRIQILQLPEGASDERAPFALVIDQHEPQRHVFGFEPSESPWDRVAEQLGARAVLYFPETVDIPANSISLAEPLLVGGSSEALTEMTRSRDEWMQRSIQAEERLERHREQRDEYRAAMRDALGIDNDEGIDVLFAVRGMRRELDQAREAIRSVLHIHRGESHRGRTICAHCSALDDQGTTDNPPVAYPCDTVTALTVRPEPETQPESPEPPEANR
jgi:hypothetical protein